MNLVQKLPIALSVACAMMLSSCSQEDVQTPEPKVAESVNTHSSEKQDLVPWIYGTKGYEGSNILPNFWERHNADVSDQGFAPVGTSNRIYLWGASVFPFQPALPAIPGQPWNSFISTSSSSAVDSKKMAIVKTTIGSLLVGKTYRLRVLVATATPKYAGIGAVPRYAKECEIRLGDSKNGVSKSVKINFANKQNTWIEKDIYFEATDNKMTFFYRALPEKEGQTAWAHLFVGSGVIVKL